MLDRELCKWCGELLPETTKYGWVHHNRVYCCNAHRQAMYRERKRRGPLPPYPEDGELWQKREWHAAKRRRYRSETYVRMSDKQEAARMRNRLSLPRAKRKKHLRRGRTSAISVQLANDA